MLGCTASWNISCEAPGWNTLQQALDVLYHKLMQLWLYSVCDVATAGSLQLTGSCWKSCITKTLCETQMQRPPHKMQKTHHNGGAQMWTMKRANFIASQLLLPGWMTFIFLFLEDLCYKNAALNIHRIWWRMPSYRTINHMPRLAVFYWSSGNRKCVLIVYVHKVHVIKHVYSTVDLFTQKTPSCKISYEETPCVTGCENTSQGLYLEKGLPVQTRGL